MKDYKGMKPEVVRPMWAKIVVRVIAVALAMVALGYVVGLIGGPLGR